METKCDHDKYKAATKMLYVNVLGDWRLVMKVSARCVKCNKQFIFDSKTRNGVSLDGTEIKLFVDYPSDELAPNQFSPGGIVN